MNFMLVEITGKRYEEKLITTSLKVAEKFEKNHQHILEAIDKLTVENFDSRRNVYLIYI